MTNVVNQLINGNAEWELPNIQMVDTDKFDILLTQEEHLYAIFRRDVFWIDHEHDTITGMISKMPFIPLRWICANDYAV